ncbi:MAG: PEP-CTERM sorting domain-containing protein [Akkermansiaceae bacterium]
MKTLAKSRTLSLSLIAFGSLSLSARTNGATVIWGAPTNIAGDSDVSTNGSLIRALNIGNSTTINGVLFEPTSFEATNGDFDFAGFTSIASSSSPNGLSASYVGLTISGYNTNSGNPTISLTMNNLTPGVQYEFQWWSNLSDPAGDYRTSANGGPELDANVSGLAGGTGQFQIGTFTADTPSQVITFAGSGTPGLFQVTGMLNGFQLRDLSGAAPIPEPNSALLLGIALLGFATCRRR